ncbi:MAG: hypothetical protein OSJ65_00630 [Bacilli bacterium]|nr:hypothetical protein [Bacilli bacterium]
MIGLTADKLVSGQTVLGITGTGGGYKAYKFEKVPTSIPSNVTLKYGSSVALAARGESNSYTIDLEFTPSEVVACELEMRGNYSPSTSSDTGENFSLPRGYVEMSHTAQSYHAFYLSASLNTNRYYSSRTDKNCSSYKMKCAVNGSKLSFVVENGYDGTSGGVAIKTRADKLYLSGTLVYK